ncbi:MAG: T9SS type A sorting domain-containing protein [Candidatus Marinimicrobia bacterium]|nr:T9SS type A sorting domain-containing protein [Candidatus Neomarinimicrobiota bacterium]
MSGKLIKFNQGIHLLFMMTLFLGITVAQELEIVNGDIELTVGDSVLLEAVYIDTSGNEIDTTVAWSILPDYLGSIDNIGLFTAEEAGEGMIYATLDTLQDSVSVVIVPVEEPTEEELPAIEITNGDVEILVDDSLQFTVVYIDTNNVEADTTGTWSVFPDSLGFISESGLFYADLPGECIVSIDLDTLNDWVTVIINVEEEEDTSGSGDGNAFILLPEDTITTIGSQVQYLAYYRAENGGAGELVDTTLTWSLQGMPIGDLSQEGLLTASATGFALIQAQFEELGGTGFVVVADSSYDSTGLNTITITKDSPNPQGYSVMRELTEGELWTIGGLPYPMNILNGGGVYFPIGSLTEDVRIHTTLPGFANVGADSVGWGSGGVIGGVDFSVMVNDTIVEPYYFETPLIVGLVFKRGLLQDLGIDPSTLGLYFTASDGDSVVFDTTGIGYPTVDLDRNRIFSSVAHFSSLVVKGETGTMVSTEPDQSTLPEGYDLMQNYPNPFNPATSIQLSIPEQTHVRIVIYNLLGQQVVTLMNHVQPSGKHQIVWNATDYQGQPVSAGIYFYQVQAGDFVRTRKMVLLK